MALTSDFPLEGFRIIRERPKLIILWGIVILFGNGVGTLLLVAMAGPSVTNMLAMGSEHIDPVLVFTLLGQATPGLLSWLVISLLTTAVITAAVCRVALGETEESIGFLKFGLREIQLAIIGGIMLGLCALIALSATAASAVLAALTPGDAINQRFFMGLGFAIAFIAIVWLRVRLSLNCAQSFDEKRLTVFGSYGLTRDWVKPLLLGYVGVALLALIVFLLCDKVIEAVVTLGSGPLSVVDMSSIRAFLTPSNLIDKVLRYGLMWPLLSAIVYGAPCAAYRALRKETPVTHKLNTLV